jgi:hypothetical protein
VFPGSFSLVMNMSDYYFFAANSDPQLVGSLFDNITNAITEGFKRLLSAREGSVVSVPLDFQTRPAQHLSQIIIEGSALMIALNASEPSSYGGWYELAIAAFNSKASPAIRNLNLLSPQTFQARDDSPILFCIAFLFHSFQIRNVRISAHTPNTDAFLPFQMLPLANSVVQTIPAMRQNEADAFEFSAVPFLLQRFPPSHLQLLANSSAWILQDLGAPQKSMCMPSRVVMQTTQVFLGPRF